MAGRGLSLLAAVVLVPGALFIGGVLIIGSMMGGFQSDETGCGTSDEGTGVQVAAKGVGGLTSSQLANAGAIIEQGNRMHIPAQGIVVALAVANQESHFTNYANEARAAT